MRIKIGIASLALATFLSIAPAFADTVCTPVYGGGQNCVTTGQLTPSKTVRNPDTGIFVANLGPNDPKFHANDNVPFQVTVTNNSGSTINNIVVVDSFPTLIMCQRSENVDCDTNGKLTINVGTLNSGQSSTLNIIGKVVSNLPAGVTCNQEPQTRSTRNIADITASNQPAQQVSSSVCLEAGAVVGKGGVTVFPPPTAVQTPPTGPEALALIGLLPVGGLGAFLRKKTSK